MKCNIVLSCEGRQDKGFIFCNGVENVILDLEKIEFSDNYEALLEYMDKVPKIFDNPCSKINVIGNVLYKIHQFDFVNEEEYSYISHFYRMQQRCGIILSAKLKQ